MQYNENKSNNVKNKKVFYLLLHFRFDSGWRSLKLGKSNLKELVTVGRILCGENEIRITSQLMKRRGTILELYLGVRGQILKNRIKNVLPRGLRR